MEARFCHGSDVDGSPTPRSNLNGTFDDPGELWVSTSSCF